MSSTVMPRSHLRDQSSTKLNYQLRSVTACTMSCQITPSIYAVSTRLKQLSALNTSFCHRHTQFLQPTNLHICIISSLFSLLAAHALHLLSLSLTLIIFSAIK